MSFKFVLECATTFQQATCMTLTSGRLYSLSALDLLSQPIELSITQLCKGYSKALYTVPESLWIVAGGLPVQRIQRLTLAVRVGHWI